jgi:hypothetical protein
MPASVIRAIEPYNVPGPIFTLPCESAFTCFMIPYPCRSPVESASRTCSTAGVSGARAVFLLAMPGYYIHCGYMST